MSSVTGSHLEQQGPDTVTINRHSLYCPFPLGLASGSCLWVLPLVQRRKPGEPRLLAGMTKNPNVLRGSKLAHPILLVGSSLIPPWGNEQHRLLAGPALPPDCWGESTVCCLSSAGGGGHGVGGGISRRGAAATTDPPGQGTVQLSQVEITITCQQTHRYS